MTLPRFLTVVLLVIFLLFQLYWQPKSSISSRKLSDSDQEFTFTLFRKGYSPLQYFTTETFKKYYFLSSYAAIIEPEANISVYIPNFVSPDYYFTYHICSSEEESSNCYDGKFNSTSEFYFSVHCEVREKFSISISKYSLIDQQFVSTSSGSAICMNVRREIRSLTSDDLNSAMDAMYTLWSTTEEEGRSKYGGRFHNSTYFLNAHAFGAAQRNTDHIHEGLGFFPQHVKMTNAFEDAMRAVNPSVSLPYWDYSIDQELGSSASDMPVFSENTFGSLQFSHDPDAGWLTSLDDIKDARIPNGRWKHLLADLNFYSSDSKVSPSESSNADRVIQNSFGYIRAPWNMNPSPYVSRFISTHAFPGCVAFYDWMEKDSLYYGLKYAPGPAHASTHGNIGGIYGCDLLDSLTSAGVIEESAQNTICANWGFKMKDLYRNNNISPKSGCDAEKVDKCSVECVQDDEGKSSMILELKDILGTFIKTEDDEDWETVRAAICDGDAWKMFAGDHLEAASPADPSFWPIHPTLERAWQAKMLAGGFSNNIWPTESTREVQRACERSACYMPEHSISTIGYYHGCCLGHREDDGFPDFINRNTSGFVEGWPTNRELLDQIDPTSESYGNSYIYDNFDWDHCKNGQDINELLSTLAEASSTKVPSFSPTEEYSISPSEEPSKEPLTSTPSFKPTEAPSHKPTKDPSYDPTHKPTEGPSHKPTKDPSYDPTHKPTEGPSHKPTKDPSYDPTHKPTEGPSHKPTKDPSYDPTHKPTEGPSHKPTKDPSYDPTHKPTEGPTISFQYSLAPEKLTRTENPTEERTLNPTHNKELTYNPTHNNEYTLSPTIPFTFNPTTKSYFQSLGDSSVEEEDEEVKKANSPSIAPRTPRPSAESEEKKASS